MSPQLTRAMTRAVVFSLRAVVYAGLWFCANRMGYGCLKRKYSRDKTHDKTPP